MKKLQLLAICMISALLVGCAGMNTTPYSNNPVETKVILSEANYQIVKAVEGQWSATYIFGIGGYSKKSLLNNAIGNMYQNAELTGNQQIINITTTVSTKSVLGVYMKKQVKAHGYVIEFLPAVVEEPVVVVEEAPVVVEEAPVVVEEAPAVVEETPVVVEEAPVVVEEAPVVVEEAPVVVEEAPVVVEEAPVVVEEAPAVVEEAPVVVEEAPVVVEEAPAVVEETPVVVEEAPVVVEEAPVAVEEVVAE